MDGEHLFFKEMPPSQANHDDEEVATVIGLYVLDEVTIQEGADRLGVDAIEFRKMLEEVGVRKRHGPTSRQDIEAEIDVARRIE